jgi:hypothetical protein
MVNTTPRLLGYRCILDEGGLETLIGQYGLIYPKGSNYYVIFWSPRVANRWGVEISQGEEGGILVDATTAKQIRKEIKTYRSLSKMEEHLQRL